MFEEFENLEQQQNVMNETGEVVENGIFHNILKGLKEVADVLENNEPISAEVFESLEGLEEYGEVSVTGNPFELAEILDYNQGDNEFGALGCCGLVSCSNFLQICGIDVSENEVVGYALENDLCVNDWFLPPEDKGGTTYKDLEAILDHYGVPSSTHWPCFTGSVDDIARAIDQGKAVAISVNAGHLWGDANFVGDGHSNHRITVTGAIRDANGEVVGLTVCDSGRGLESDACRILTKEQLKLCYEDVLGANAVISDRKVR